MDSGGNHLFDRVGGTQISLASWTRRDFVKGAGALIGGAGLGAYAHLATAEPPAETTRIRLFEADGFGTCLAPQYVAQELLKLEGFTDVRYVKYPSETQREQ